MRGSLSEVPIRVADSFFSGAYGPKSDVILIADPLPGAPTEEEVWASWERRCVYVGDEELDLDEQRWAQWTREPYPALHAAYAVRIDGRPPIEVARTYPSAIQIDPRNDLERSKTGERLICRGDRLWALIGAWPWGLPEVQDRALAEGLSPSWSWESPDLTAVASSLHRP